MSGPVASGPGEVLVLVESDYFEPEIHYYLQRFAAAGLGVTLASRLWGQPRLTFTGHEWRAPLKVETDLEAVDDQTLAGLAAVVVPSGMVADRLRYTEVPGDLSPAARLLERAFAQPVLKGVICHGMWLLAGIPQTVRGRPLTCHNNLVHDVRNMGADYRDQDVVVDGDLVTGRTGRHAHLFAEALLEQIRARQERSPDDVAAGRGAA